MYAIIYRPRSAPKDQESAPGAHGDDAVPFSVEVRELKERIRQLERMLGKKTLP
jgi:hypothetical protein